MKVVYTGPYTEVRIPQFEMTAKRGEPLTVPEAIGTRLVRQADWQEEGKAKEPAPAKTRKVRRG